MPTLYHVPLSPFCRKVRLSLAEKRVECELVEVKYWEKEPEFLRRNPAGKVPVLKIDGKLLAESSAICEWIEEVYPEPSLMPETPDERAEVVAAIEAIDLRGERALAVVHDALRDPSPSVRAAACAAAAAHWVRHPDGPLAVDERTVRLLKRCCRSEDWRTRTRAAEAMAAIGLVA